MEKIRTLKDTPYSKRCSDDIAKVIAEYFANTIFKPCLEIIKENSVQNDTNIIISAIRSGLLYYQNGAFYSKTGKFSNAISLELEKIGARYSKYARAYTIAESKLPIELLGAIDILKAKTAIKAVAIQNFLDSVLKDIGQNGIKLILDEAVNTMFLDLQTRMMKNLQAKKIEVIVPELTDFRANEIAQKYTNNLKYWIKNWTDTDIPKMREVVGQMARSGKSRKSIEEYLIKEFKVSGKKAKFLARNESAIATMSYKVATYQEQGFTHYIWRTNLDGRERELHKKLNGTIQRFDSPPVNYQQIKKGVIVREDRGHPQQTYNCRCDCEPIINKEFMENRKNKNASIK